MKAEEYLKSLTLSKTLKSFVVATMKEYARGQIIKDRERVKNAYYTTDDLLSDTIKDLPIEIGQSDYTKILIDVSETDIVAIWQRFDLVQIKRSKIQQLIDILEHEKSK